jgi:hypothetical protein
MSQDSERAPPAMLKSAQYCVLVCSGFLAVWNFTLGLG